MNFEEYTNKMPFPKKESFNTTYYYSRGNLVATKRGEDIEIFISTIPLDKCLKEKSYDKDGFGAAVRLYNQESARLEEKFKTDLFENLGITSNPKAEMLYSRAYESGHSSGFSEIYNVASDLVDLITPDPNLVKIINRAESALTYTEATIARGNQKPTDDKEWVSVHAGRAYSSYNQLKSVLDDIHQLQRDYLK